MSRVSVQFLLDAYVHMRGWEVAQWAKRLPYKHEDMGLDSRYPCKKAGVMVCVCNPSTKEVDLQSLLAIHSTQSVSSRFSEENLFQKIRVVDQHKTSDTPFSYT